MSAPSFGWGHLFLDVRRLPLLETQAPSSGQSTQPRRDLSVRIMLARLIDHMDHMHHIDHMRHAAEQSDLKPSGCPAVNNACGGHYKP